METRLDKLTREARERIRNMPKIDFTVRDEESFDRAEAMAQAEYDAEYRKWLSYYDDEGRLKRSARGDPGYNASMRHVPIRLTDEEAAAFIVAEKKRLGVV